MKHTKLEIKETRLTALAVDGDSASTQSPVFAVYLTTPDEQLFELVQDENVPIFTIKNLIVPKKNGRNLRTITVVFDVELADGSDKTYAFDMDSQYLMTLFPLHLAGEVYIAVFPAGTRVHSRKKALSNNDLEVLLALPELESDEFRSIATKFNLFTSYRSTSSIVNSEDYMDAAELDALKKVRKDLFIRLSELAEGDITVLETLRSYIEPLNVYEENVLQNNFDPADEEVFFDALVTLTDQLLFKINVRNIIPKKMEASDVSAYHKTYDEFNEIMGNLGAELSTGLEILAANDEKFLKDKSNPEALASYMASAIRKDSMPESMKAITDLLDFGGVFDTDWTTIDSVAEFIDVQPEDRNYSFGESVIAALVACTIRIARISEVNGNAPVSFFLNVFSDVIAVEADTHWELEAFSSNLAKGETKLFQQLLLGLPKDVPMSTLINVSYIGFIGYALANSIMKEGWQLDIIRIAFADNKIAIRFIEEAFANISKFAELAVENEYDEEENMSLEKREAMASMMEAQIVFQSIQEALTTIGSEYDSAQEISSAVVEAMLQLADLNTGKQTISAVDSEEWLGVKEEYLSKFFNLNRE